MGNGGGGDSKKGRAWNKWISLKNKLKSVPRRHNSEHALVPVLEGSLVADNCQMQQNYFF